MLSSRSKRRKGKKKTKQKAPSFLERVKKGTTQHGTSSHMHHSVRGPSPSPTMGIDPKHKKLLESHFHNRWQREKKERKKKSNHKTKQKNPPGGGVFYVVTCGMIRDHPGMLRLVRLHCAASRLVYGGRREDGRHCERKERKKMPS